MRLCSANGFPLCVCECVSHKQEWIIDKKMGQTWSDLIYEPDYKMRWPKKEKRKISLYSLNSFWSIFPREAQKRNSWHVRHGCSIEISNAIRFCNQIIRTLPDTVDWCLFWQWYNCYVTATESFFTFIYILPTDKLKIDIFTERTN